MKKLGNHILIEFYDCNAEKLDDLAFLEQELKQGFINTYLVKHT